VSITTFCIFFADLNVSFPEADVPFVPFLIYEPYKNVFQKIDHSSIYLLIAGTYTPYLMVSIGGLVGYENKVQFVLVEAANRAEFLASDKVDITLANFTVTPERKEVVDFALPYMKVALGVASKDGDITDVSQLKDKTLLINKGTTADLYFTKNHPEIKLLKFDQNTETFGAMLDGRGDAIAHDNTLLFAWTKSNPGFKVGIRSLGDQDVIAPAVKKGNDELRKWLDDLIVKLADEKFFHADYDATLAPVYGDDIKADDVVIEGGKL